MANGQGWIPTHRLNASITAHSLSGFLFCYRRRHVTSHRSSSFTLLQSLAIEDSRDKPTYSVLLGQLFAFIGTNPDQAVSHVLQLQMKQHGGRVTAGVRGTSFSCISGVQQQLSFGRTDKVAAGKHSQAGPGAHAGVADGCCSSRGSDSSCGSSDYGPARRTQVSGFC